MGKEEEPKIPEPSKPHPNLSDRINRNIAESELAGGVWLEEMLVGEKLRVVTHNRTYIIWKKDDGYYIKGHPEFCPDFVKVEIAGSTWNRTTRAMLKMKFVGNGMFLEFNHPEHGVIHTSRIEEVVPLSNEEERLMEEYEKEVAEGVEEIKKEKAGL